MIGFCYPLLVLLTIIQVVSYYLYNGRFHPFALIVMPEKNCNEKSFDDPMDECPDEDTNPENESELILDPTIKTSSDMESVL